ncbi:MAG: 4-hydroxy-tetrahydrodipicolinate reductase [Clostridiales bacterium]|nr:4-hydroxy-tetrahydrodipicolinate reductase [Clostridiales bacterium]
MNIIIHGCNGRMGRMLTQTISEHSEYNVICGVDPECSEGIPYPVYRDFAFVPPKADVVIDFSHPAAIKDLLGWCILHDSPVVIATTGLGQEEHRIIQEASKQIPVFQSANMSLGIHALCKALSQISAILGSEFDTGIFETHHKYKKDAPSGTAYLLKDALNSNSTAVTALRLGTIPGEHTVIFAGEDEVLELTHTAYSRKIFAVGVLKAAEFLIVQKPGLYNMNDL